ncbi:uncharacterized protein LOC121135235 [Mesocricetus auratus]|uniref:Uncharacterized protein LOC121135235 n=1 Tax=Mesocricetus auratus TaxID=10036 RepID=A0ABM2WFK0_MESAU|nr:uncharacterized protein LOC121135235 [Mesocricetus auratus]
MSDREKDPHVRDQHNPEDDDLVSLTPSNSPVTKVTNGSSGEQSEESDEPVQSALPRRPWGCPAKKHSSVETGGSDEETCTAENKPSTEKHHIAKTSYTACMYYVMPNVLLPKMIMIDDDACDDEECPTTEKGPCDRKHHFKKQLSGMRYHSPEESHSIEEHLSAEKDLPTQGGCLNQKRCLTEKDHSTEEGGLGERGPYEERGHSTERCQPAKKGLSMKKSSSPNEGDLDGRGPFVENHHPEEKDRSAKKLSCTQRDCQIDGECSVKRELSTEEDHPIGRGLPANKSHLAEKGWSTNKSGSAGRGHHLKSHPAKEGRSEEWVNLARSRLYAGEDTPTWRGHRIQGCPVVEGRSVKRENTVKERPSTVKDHPTGTSHPQKKSHSPEKGRSPDRGYTTGQNLSTRRGRLPKRSLWAENHLSAENSCPPKKSRLPEKDLSSKRIHFAVHPEERQLSANKESVEKKFRSGESVEIQDSYTHEESNTGDNGYSVEQGHPSMEKGFHVETPSSGSMPVVPMPNSMQDAPQSSIGSDTSQVPQVTHHNVAGAVTNGQRMQTENMRIGVELKLPQKLKACLVQDWNLVNTQMQLFHLPADKNVDRILADYVNFVKSQEKCDNREYSVDELVYGIREYFNKMLGTQLLCQFERPQYADILLAYPGIPMSQVYGAPHLLRLFVNIGSALTHLSFNRGSLMLLSGYMHDFLNYLAENSTSLFRASDYELASVAYCFKAL